MLAWRASSPQQTARKQTTVCFSKPIECKMSLWVAVMIRIPRPGVAGQVASVEGNLRTVHVSREQDVIVYHWLMPFISLLVKANIGR